MDFWRTSCREVFASRVRSALWFFDNIAYTFVAVTGSILELCDYCILQAMAVLVLHCTNVVISAMNDLKAKRFFESLSVVASVSKKFRYLSVQGVADDVATQ